MSSRQVVYLLTCLCGLVGTAPVVRAQVSSQVSPTERVQPTASRPATSDRYEPAPLRKEGFIQQLRALPQASVQALQEAENRQFRLPPRTNQVRRVQGNTRVPDAATQNNSPQRNYSLPAQPTGRSTLQHTHESPWVERINQRELTHVQTTRLPQTMPPTYSGLQNRPVTSYQLIGEQSRFAGQTQTWDEPADQWESADNEFSDTRTRQQNFPAATLAEPSLRRISNGNTEIERFGEVVADRSLPNAELDVGEEPQNEAFEALTGESLQRAPRVSRVPLPRSAVTVKDSPEPISQSAEERFADAPARIVATPISTTPNLGSARTGKATLKSGMSDIQDISRPNSDSSFSLPELHLPAPTLAGPRLPELPSSSTSIVNPMSESAPAAKPADSLSTNRQSLSDTASEDSASESVELAPLGFEPTSLGVTLPAAPSLAVTAPAPSSSAPAFAAPTISARPADHMPLLTLEGTQLKAPLDPLASSDQRLKMEAPRIAVVLNGPSDLPIGTPAQYEIVVRNEDSIDLQGLILRMDIPSGVKVNTLKPTHGQFELESAPDGLTMVTWSFEQLVAGQNASAPMQLVAGSAQNFAVAMEWTLVPIAGTSSIDVRMPRLELALDGPSEVRFGEPNTYRLHIRNPGTAAAHKIAVRLSADPFGSSSAEIEHIAPGEEDVIEVELTFNERGTINIAALAEEQSGLASETAIAVIVRQALVEAQLMATPLVYHGTPTECRVRLDNNGDADALDLRAALELPEGAGLVSAPPGAVLSGRTLTWQIEKLKAGSSEEYSLQLKLTAEGTNTFALQCRGPGNVSATAETVAQVESITDLKLFVNDPLAPAPVGSEVVYELTLTNRGSKAATNVKVVAQFSDGIEPTRGEGHTARVVPGQTLFEPLPRLAAGETVNLKVFAKAAASGIHRFRVEVRSDESEVRLVQEESTQYLEPVSSRMAAPMSRSSTLR